MTAAATSYLDYSSLPDRLSGGVRIIPINTAHGTFKVWTKRVGNNPRVKLLLLHGGPGATHEYFEACDSYLPAAGGPGGAGADQAAGGRRAVQRPALHGLTDAAPLYRPRAAHARRAVAGMARILANGRYLDCPGGSHLAMYDDQQVYFDGLIRFMAAIDGASH
jgi:hypothetical protein